jgi:hypothetical protein
MLASLPATSDRKHGPPSGAPESSQNNENPSPSMKLREPNPASLV